MQRRAGRIIVVNYHFLCTFCRFLFVLRGRRRTWCLIRFGHSAVCRRCHCWRRHPIFRIDFVRFVGRWQNVPWIANVFDQFLVLRRRRLHRMQFIETGAHIVRMIAIVPMRMWSTVFLEHRLRRTKVQLFVAIVVGNVDGAGADVAITVVFAKRLQFIVVLWQSAASLRHQFAWPFVHRIHFLCSFVVVDCFCCYCCGKLFIYSTNAVRLATIQLAHSHRNARVPARALSQHTWQ